MTPRERELTVAAGSQDAGRGGAGRRPLRARFLLALFSVLVTLLLAEAGLRIIGYHPPEILTGPMVNKVAMMPGAKFVYRGYLEGTICDFANPVTLNSMGFHDVEHLPERATPGIYRLLVIGDSYVAALSCPLETAFFRRLEKRLVREDPLGCGRYEVIALGKGNQGQAKEIQYLANFGPLYRPDAVLLLFFCGNDFMENSHETFAAASHFAKMYKEVIAPRKERFHNRVFLIRNSRVNGLLADAATMFYADHLNWFDPRVRRQDLVSPELGVYRVPLEPMWKDAYARTGAMLELLKEECERIQAPLWVAGLSAPQALGDVGSSELWHAEASGLDRDQPERWLDGWCRSNRVPYVNLGPALRAAGMGRVYWRHDGHLNPRGNLVITAPIFSLVCREGKSKADRGR